MKQQNIKPFTMVTDNDGGGGGANHRSTIIQPLRSVREQKITPVQDDFLDGFNADDRTSWYTGKWESVQADTAGSGRQREC